MGVEPLHLLPEHLVVPIEERRVGDIIRDDTQRDVRQRGGKGGTDSVGQTVADQRTGREQNQHDKQKLPPADVRIHTAVSVSQTFSTTMFPIALSFNLVTKFIPMFRYYFLVFAHMF